MIELRVARDAEWLRLGRAALPFPDGGAVGAVSWGWELTSANTGLAALGIDKNNLATYSGTPTSGQTISDRRITDQQDLGGFNNGNFNGPLISNVTYERCWFTGETNRRVVLGPGTVIQDCEFDGTASPQGTDRIGIYSNLSSGQSASIERCYLTGDSVGMWLDGGAGSAINVTDTYVLATASGTTASDPHIDSFTRREGTGTLNFTRCRLALVPGNATTGAYFLQPWASGSNIAGVTTTHCLFESDNIAIVMQSQPSTTTICAFVNCRVNPLDDGSTHVQDDFGGTINVTSWEMWRYSPGDPVNGTDGGRKGTVVTL